MKTRGARNILSFILKSMYLHMPHTTVSLDIFLKVEGLWVFVRIFFTILHANIIPINLELLDLVVNLVKSSF